MRLAIGEPVAPCPVDAKEDEHIRIENALKQMAAIPGN